MNEPLVKQLLQAARGVRRLAQRLTHARKAASPDQVPLLASLEKLACQTQKALDTYIERKTYQSVRPLFDLKEVRRCFRERLPLPGEPLHWHLPTTFYDVCPTCGSPTIERVGRRCRFCTSCNDDWCLSHGVGHWKEQMLRACQPKRLPEDDPLPCSFPGCDWDRYRGEWCDFHGNQARKARKMTPNPKPRKPCQEPDCRRSCIPQSDYCGIHPSNKQP